MLLKRTIEKYDLARLRSNLLEFARNYEFGCILDSNSEEKEITPQTGLQYDILAGFANEESKGTRLREFSNLASINEHNSKWMLGYLTYDLKNSIEALSSENADQHNWPPLFFFEPEILIKLEGKELSIETNSSVHSARGIFDSLLAIPSTSYPKQPQLELEARMSKSEYLEKFHQIQSHIKKGNIYETNFCQEFFHKKEIDPFAYYLHLSTFSPSPFSSFFRYHSNFLLSASPERYVKKTGSRIISQPIKGTAARGKTQLADVAIKEELVRNPKERSENIMIVDLVRNDLSRIAKLNSVKVEELCKSYSFPKVHQLISTISAEIENQNFQEIITATFPMGSMTGAPKVEAMKIAEELETTKRGLYSGAVGYIAPGFNFDFNVVIRSLQYQAETSYLSYLVGSAITALSEPELEYQECLLKVYGLNRKLSSVSYA